MAMYIPLSRRRRNAALVAIATLLAGLIVGFIVGRSSATTAPEAAADARARGDELATHVAALTIEYDQAVSGGEDTIQGGVLDALDLVDSDLDRLIADAPWISKAQADSLHVATTAVRTAAQKAVPADEFANITAATAATIRASFGVDG
jgi:hypothetical protein